MKRFSGVVAAFLGALAWVGFASAADAHTVYVATTILGPSSSSSLVPIEGSIAQEPIEGPWARLRAAAVSPDGKTLYVVDDPTDGGSSVYKIDTTGHEVVAEIPVLNSSAGIAVSPDAQFAYVTSLQGSNGVTVIDATQNTAVASFALGSQPYAVALTPDGARGYVTNLLDVSVIDPTQHEELARITDENMYNALGAAITPDGKTVYVANRSLDNVAAIDTATDTVETTIPVGTGPVGVAITPDGKRAYVSSYDDDSVSVINTKNNAVIATVPVDPGPMGIAATPDGKRVYVANAFGGSVSIIDTATNNVEATVTIDGAPWAIAIVPNQPPTAELQADALTVSTGTPVAFDVSGSDDETAIESYTFDFGDGSQATSGEPTRKHAYAEPGTYEAVVTVDDGEGCEPVPQFLALGMASPFTGQTAHCNGPSRVTSDPVQIKVVGPPKLRLAMRLERRQRSLREVRVAARCKGADCRVRAGGELHVKRPGRKAKRFALVPDARELKASGKAQLRPRIAAQARRAARRALKAGGKVRATLRVRATAAQDQERLRMRSVRIVPR